MPEWWKAKTLADIDFDPRTVEESKLISIIKALGARTISPRVYHELRAIAMDRGIDLENPYKDEKIAEDSAQKRIAAIHGVDDTTPLNDRIVLAGRRSIDDLVAKSGLFSGDKLNHTPFLVFHDQGESMHIIIVNNSNKLLEFPDETKVMVQWKGKWSSDYFQFTVGEIRSKIEKAPQQETFFDDSALDIRKAYKHG